MGWDLLCRPRGGYLQLGLEGKLLCRSWGGGDLLCRSRGGYLQLGLEGKTAM